jgi:adenine-specific DNA-methyltransferase
VSDQPFVANTFLEGDNAEVMPRLAAESFDLIYADPPYNTGNAFAWSDRYGGHEDWVAFMRPRLVEAHRLLAPTGALWLSIDEHEMAHLWLLLAEVFGEENLLAQLVVSLNPKGRQLGGGFATTHEYLLVAAKDASRCVLDASSPDTVEPADFPLTTDHGRAYRHLPLRNTNKKFNPATAPTLHYPLWGDPRSGRVSVGPFEGATEVWPVFGDGTPAVWRWSPAKVTAQPGDVVCRSVRGRAGERVDVFQRDWLHRETPQGSVQRRKKLRTIWTSAEVGSTDTAIAELKALLGHVFDNPKPTGLLLRILGTMPPDVRVLDFFAGSGTTGHAVVLANTADGGRRTCVSINAPEPTRPDSRAAQAGYETVSAITRARLRAVGPLLEP